VASLPLTSTPRQRTTSTTWRIFHGYTEAGEYSLHVKKADEAYQISKDPLSGYLNPHHIVNMAVETGCDALHPGYGFLSENAELAAICEQRGITFVGPSRRWLHPPPRSLVPRR